MFDKKFGFRWVGVFWEMFRGLILDLEFYMLGGELVFVSYYLILIGVFWYVVLFLYIRKNK